MTSNGLDALCFKTQYTYIRTSFEANYENVDEYKPIVAYTVIMATMAADAHADAHVGLYTLVSLLRHSAVSL